ncbi:MAG: V-type ATP synthase subunit I [Thermoplasmata archaeon]|nr:V-type ATP synthase subunit I [Thermoplasmata archaeon]
MPSQMSKISILLHKKDSEHVIKKLHESGLMEITKVKNEFFEEGKMNPLVEKCAHYELRLARIIDILKGYERKKKLRDLFKQPERKKLKVKKKNFKEKIQDAKKLLEEIEGIVIKNLEKIERIEETKEELKVRVAALKYLSLFNIDVSWLGKSRYTIIKFGIADKPLKLENVTIYSKPIGEKKERKYAVLVVAPVYMEKELAKLRMEEISIEGKGLAKDLLKEAENELKEIEKKRKRIIEEMRKLYEKKKIELLAIKEEIHIEKEEKEIQIYFGESSFTFLIEGYALTENVEKLRKIVEEATNKKCSFHARKVPREKEAPIHLKNPKWAKPFETFVELFSLPKYNEVNPTLFIGFSFIIFFSFMLGDAGYGLIIFLLSLLAYIKFKGSEFTKQWSFIGIWLGLGNLVTGFLFNGFFGDFIPRFIYHDANKTLYHVNIAGVELPIDAIHKPVIILGIALLLGLIHLNMGFILGVIQNIKRKHKKAILIEQFPWFLLQIGGGMLIGSSLLALWSLNGMEEIIAYALTVIGLAILFKEKGALGFFDVTGYVGDWLSYARLLALGLATAGMALAFNIVAELLPNIVPYIGIILIPVILIITHLANLMIQSLGAAIHALRLQYVEFFNRFYEGGGKRYKPFSISRKYTEEIK